MGRLKGGGDPSGEGGNGRLSGETGIITEGTGINAEAEEGIFRGPVGEGCGEEFRVGSKVTGQARVQPHILPVDIQSPISDIFGFAEIHSNHPGVCEDVIGIISAGIGGTAEFFTVGSECGIDF